MVGNVKGSHPGRGRCRALMEKPSASHRHLENSCRVAYTAHAPYLLDLTLEVKVSLFAFR